MWTRMGCGWRHTRLRRAAIGLAAHGWPVIPGASLVGQRFSCGTGCRTVACHPSFAHDQGAATPPGEAVLHDPDLVVSTWRHTPHAVLLATGESFDVIETPTWLALAAGRGTVRGPVARTPAGRWMFLVRPGAVLRADLAALPDVVLHGEGSWIPAPPTRTPQGSVRWIVSPEEADWRAPAAALVQAWLAGGLPQWRTGYPQIQAA